MTAVISAIFGKNNRGQSKKSDEAEHGVILMADKMISFGVTGLEANVSKIDIICNKKDVYVAAGGSGGLGWLNEFFVKIKSLDPSKLASVRDYAIEGGKIYREILRDDFSRKFLDPYGIPIKEVFKKETPEDFQRYITNNIEKWKDHYLGWEFLICGVDKDGPHIYTISEGDYNPNDMLGYEVTGSGTPSAQWVLAHEQYDPRKDRMYSLFMTAYAKRQAEESLGVGQRTDAILISNKGVEFIQEEIIDKIKSEIDIMLDDKKKDIFNKIDYLKNNGVNKDVGGKQP